jgi:hypothetical protein
MSFPESSIMLIMGIVFIGVGIGVYFGNKRAEQSYDDSLMERTDMREFLETTPERSGYGSFRIGGIICIVVGAVLLGLGLGLRFLG